MYQVYLSNGQFKIEHLLKYLKSLVVVTNIFLVAYSVHASNSSFCEHSALKIETDNGTLFYQVEVASTPRKRQEGLMYRRVLLPGKGMLFIFEEPTYAQFWMKNTFLELDLIFANELGVITQVIRRAEPGSLDIMKSDVLVKYVFEVSSKDSMVQSIKVGNYIQHCTIAYSDIHTGN